MLMIAGEELDTMRSHAEQSYPNECCGALLGRRDGPRNIVHSIVPCENLRPSPTRYEIAPRDLLQLRRAARVSGREIVGFFHYHHEHEAIWSETDLADAHWIGCSYVIVDVRAGKAAEVKSYRLVGSIERQKQFDAEEIDVQKTVH
jgi:proteasome lid subunit RPN8/RPN11